MQIKISTNFPDVARQLANLQKDIGEKAVASALNKTVALAKTAMQQEDPGRVQHQRGHCHPVAEGAACQCSEGQVPAERCPVLDLPAWSAQPQPGTLLCTPDPQGCDLQGQAQWTASADPWLVPDQRRGHGDDPRGQHARLPIKALQTIDVGQMFNTRRINAKVVQLIEARFPDIFANEARFFTARFNAGR